MNIIKISIVPIISLAIFLTLSSCGNKQSELDSHDHHAEEAEMGESHGHESESEEDGSIHLTKEQIETVGIELGDMKPIKINDFISATGTLGLPPQSYASVSTKTSGFIKNSNKYVEGSKVKKGAIIAYLENPELIKTQQEYLEVEGELTYLRQELERQQKLVNEDAGVIKQLQKLQSEVSVKTAKLKGIAKQLAYLGIDIKELTPDNIKERIAIIAPISGYATSVNMHNGMYVTPEMRLMDIINEQHLHLELDVFEKDISKLKEEQKISYTVPALGSEIYEGEVHVIGKEFNTENKTVRIHGHLVGKRPRFIKDLFVEAKIWLNDQTVQALPQDAIIKDGSASYIYITFPAKQQGDEVQFTKVEVIPGTEDKGFIAVKLLQNLPEDAKIVVKGAYYVYAQSKAGELEHEH